MIYSSSSYFTAAAAAAKSLQSCPTLCDPIDGSPPGSPVPGILQARTLEWVAISSSNAWKWKNKVKSLSRVRLLATPWTAVHQAPPSTGFSRQEYWSGLPFNFILIVFINNKSFTFKFLFIYLLLGKHWVFVAACRLSSFSEQELELVSSCGAQVSLVVEHGLSAHGLLLLWLPGLVALWPVESSQIRNQTCAPYIGRQTPN